MDQSNIKQKLSLSSKIVGAILLISGTSIGGGMLALPVVTAEVGFVPSLLLFILTWSFMTFTAFLLLECNLATKHGSNLISMSRGTLGRTGVGVTWVSYLLLLYSLMAAYISGIGSILKGAIQSTLHLSIPSISTHAAVVVMLLIIYRVRLVDQLNRIFVIIGALCFGFLMMSLASHVQISHLSRAQFTNLSSPLPVLVTAFGFHIIIPVLIRYLDRNAAVLRYCLAIGSLIPLLIYCAWQLCVMGSIPLSELTSNPDQLSSLIHSMTIITGNKWVETASSLFCAFAILTSLIGVALSLWDFLIDGLSQAPRLINNRISLSLATIGPPLCFVLWFPHIFSDLLGYAGIFVSILLGLLPIAIAWKGRAQESWGEEYKAPGGKAALMLATFFFLYVIGIELFL